MSTSGGLVGVYRDKFARLGMAIFAVAVVVTSAHPFLPGHHDVHRAGFYLAIAGAVVCEVAFDAHVRRYGWQPVSMVHRRAFLWGAEQAAWITLGMAASGGGRSPLFLLYTLIVVAYVTHLPPLGRYALLLLIIAMYSTMAEIGGTWPGWGVAALGFAVLGAVQAQSSRATVELFGHLDELSAAHQQAERRLAAEAAARAEADRLNQLKKDFIHTASHELRTPLTVVHGLSDLLDTQWERLDDDQRAAAIARIRSNTTSLIDLINTYLDFGRLESGRLEAEPAAFDVGDVVEGVVDRLGSMFTGRQLVLHVDRGLNVIADRQLVDQTLVNLLANASDHTNDGATITIEVHQAGDAARISVGDDGPGIPASELVHLGTPFFRGAASAGRRGSGLGLAYCREALRLHDRDLDVASEPGRGATFSFSLPLVSGDDGVVDLTG